MLLADEKYAEAGLGKELCLALIADFNTLIALSQENQTPIYALADSVLGVGVVLEQNQRKRQEFFDCFSKLADEVIDLAGLDDGSGAV
jgi:hypothetical protein